MVKKCNVHVQPVMLLRARSMACFTGCPPSVPAHPLKYPSYILTPEFVPSDPSLSAVFFPPPKNSTPAPESAAARVRPRPPPAEKLKSFAAIADWESGVAEKKSQTYTMLKWVLKHCVNLQHLPASHKIRVFKDKRRNFIPSPGLVPSLHDRPIIVISHRGVIS